MGVGGVSQPITEAALQQTLMQAAELYGYRCFHTRAARSGRGWRVPVQGAGAEGFPDLILASTHADPVFAFELKGPAGRLGPGQEAWLAALDGARLHARVVRGLDGLDEVLHLLTTHAPPRRSREAR
jgi:hypothetical protein